MLPRFAHLAATVPFAMAFACQAPAPTHHLAQNGQPLLARETAAEAQPAMPGPTGRNLVGVVGHAAATSVPAAARDPAIAEHQREKLRLLTGGPTGRAERLSRAGLRADPDREECAVYVHDRWDAAQQQALAAQGIAVNPDVWVPPVPQHGHAFGFHVASIAYDRVDALLADPNVVRVASLETPLRPQNDLGRAAIKADVVQAGPPVRTGAGVKVCVADTSFDLTHADLPKPVEAYDVTTGATVAGWSTDVHSTVTDHGTHVAGIVAGSGAFSGGKYRGVAPGASLYLYKVGDNATGNALSTDEIKAVQRAQAVGCKIFQLSFGGFGGANDGSGPMEQALDAATAAGMVSVIAAGNSAKEGTHAISGPLAAGATANLVFSVTNSGSAALTAPFKVVVVWRDSNAAANNMQIGVSGLGAGESAALGALAVTPRSTKSVVATVTPSIAAGAKRTYAIALQNIGTFAVPNVHVYLTDAPDQAAAFAAPDSSTVINAPGDADTAITIGNYVSRTTWTSYKGLKFGTSEVLGTVATSSSRGPRIDGAQKPDVLAPGAEVISLRDVFLAAGPTNDGHLIDDDGLNQNGSGPAHYAVEGGTSMAAPMVTGAIALLLEGAPASSPAGIKAALLATAANGANWDANAGHGLIDISKAIAYQKCGDGAVTGNEKCDDGNAADGDCCSATCQPVANGTACSDGNPCSGPDVCAAGACTSTISANGSPCSDGDACNGAESCQGGVCAAASVSADQVQAKGTAAIKLGSGFQTFVAGTSGKLAQVVVRNNNVAGSFAVKLAVFSGGGTAGPLLASATVQVAGLQDLPLNLPAGAQPALAAGQTYTFQIAEATGQLQVQLDCGNPYAAGQFIGAVESKLCAAPDLYFATKLAAGTAACQPLDQCHDAGTCTGPNGACTNPAKPDGAACSDNSACTTGDLCAAGSCKAGSAVNCNDGNPCTDDSCNPASGCVHLNNSATCTDNSACTTGDICAAGSCKAGNAVNCNDSNPCTDDSCNPASGCVHLNNSATCTDNSACTTGDVCTAGSCKSGSGVNCNDSNPCTDDSCNPASGCVHLNNSATCTDNSACTTGDICAAGSCKVGNAVNCNDGNPCTDDSCNPASGCAHLNNSAACSDNNACTSGDVCAAGSCKAGSGVNCNDSNPCTDDSCNLASGCVHLNNSAACSDNNACTTGDICAAGSCKAGSAVNCNDSNPCTDDSCNPASGCAHLNNSAACSDNNACTTGDVCAAGSCKAGSAVNCNDSNPCTDDSCSPASGCVHFNNSAACSDNSACTTGDVCAAGSCKAGNAVNCNDSNPCTDDACNPASGCAHLNNAAACSDNSACTTGDLCAAGSCKAGSAVNCNDSNPCTDDSCSPASGCVHFNNSAACSDGNPCTVADQCVLGLCMGGAATGCAEPPPDAGVTDVGSDADAQVAEVAVEIAEAAPELPQPDASPPDAGQPDTAQAEAAPPEAGAPEILEPDTAPAEVAQPELPWPAEDASAQPEAAPRGADASEPPQDTAPRSVADAEDAGASRVAAPDTYGTTAFGTLTYPRGSGGCAALPAGDRAWIVVAAVAAWVCLRRRRFGAD